MAEVRVIRPADRAAEVSSGSMKREAAISLALTGAQRIWTGYAELPPGLVSGAHHHGEAESSIYMISGHARFVTGSGTFDAGPGDFVFVPPHAVHVEANTSDTETVRMVVSRTTQETLVFNVDMPEGWADQAAAR